MSGVCSEALRKKVLALGPFPDLKAAFTLCHAEESAENTIANLSSRSLVNAASRSCRPQSSTSTHSPQQSGQEHASQEHNNCRYCRRHSTPTNKTHKDCPVYGTTCLSYGKEHHFAAVLHARRQKSHGQRQRQFSCSRCLIQSPIVSSLGPNHTSGERLFGMNGNVMSFCCVTLWKKRAAFTPDRIAAHSKRPSLARPSCCGSSARERCFRGSQ